MDKLGQSIQIATVFFILSLVSERFITWFKLYFFKKGNTLLGFFNWDEDYSAKSDDPVLEKKREEKILALNISLSILIAFLINANLFTLLKGDPTNSLGWQNFELHYKDEIDWSLIFLELIGCIVGGLLMSLGSKFWHDTLDMLYYTKNLKDKLVEKETYKINTLKELDEWIAVSEADIIQKAFEEHKATLKNLKNVISVGISHDQNNSKFISVVISDTDIHLIPTSIPYFLPNNLVKTIPVKVFPSSKITTQSNQITFGDNLVNNSRPNFFGSYGLAVKFKGKNDASNLILSCYHVVIGKNHDFKTFRFQNEEDIISTSKKEKTEIGTIRNAVRNNLIDAAIVEVEKSLSISNNLPNGKNINKTRSISYSEQFNNIPVRIYGFLNQSNTAMGSIHSINNHATIEYTLPNNGGKEDWDLYGLIAINNDGKSISQPGDSGAPLLDNDNNIIGIIVAGSDTFTYAIPIQSIFDQLNIELL
ncbi:hypothetical protein [Flavobacterium sp. Root186]|uniref:hypothetical protein n=1 Tax=Flavobacterium sp. Root186 TaxID=1736485 RepID=UPI0006FC30CB|nr:hypothetical protein [Flavobacterium sp. Root186]KRB56364.1 hypothetical protein ASD98_10915 [Flavobacterium sp. Root186]